MKNLKGFRFRIAWDITFLTRAKVCEILCTVLNSHEVVSSTDEEYLVIDKQLKYWHLIDNLAIYPMRRRSDGIIMTANTSRVMLLTPLLNYEEDMGIIRALVSNLNSAGAEVNSTCSLNISIEAPDYFSPHELLNVLNIMYSKGDLLNKALGVHKRRMLQWTLPLPDRLLYQLNRQETLNYEDFKRIWFSEGFKKYEKNMDSLSEFHATNYFAVSLNDYFQFDKTIKFRIFNSSVSIFDIENYLTLCFLIINRASGSHKESANYYCSKFGNDAFAMNKWLIDIGASGDEFRSFREFMLRLLPGNLEADNAEFETHSDVYQNEELRVLDDFSEACVFTSDFSADVLELARHTIPEEDDDDGDFVENFKVIFEKNDEGATNS